MKPPVELFSVTYKNYAEELYKAIRKETYGEDMGQTSWLTIEEYRSFFSLLELAPDKTVLEIAVGSGGPAAFMVKETACRLVGIDLNVDGVNNARKIAEEKGLSEHMEFRVGDASKPLPFADSSFDAVITFDSINHFRNRGKVLREFKRVLKKGGRLLYTDPIVVTGILTNEEIAIRSSLGFFLFVPAGENERLLREAGYQEIQCRDVTENMASVSISWFKAREKRKHELLQIEEENNYEGLQAFFKMVHTLASEKRLSRFMFTAVK